MNKQEFVQERSVGEFVRWLCTDLPEMQFRLNFKPSRQVPGGLETSVKGVEAVTEKYTWNAVWTTLNNEPVRSGDWGTTNKSLAQLRLSLTDALDRNAEKDVYRVCLEILQWGGVRSARRLLTQLCEESALVHYLTETRRAFSIASDAPLDRFGTAIRRMDSGMTKIHALASEEGLPIYDSRVGAAVSGLVAIFFQGKDIPPSLLFPTGSARGAQRRNPGDFTGFSRVPEFYTPRVRHVDWAEAQLRLGWLLEEVLKTSRLFSSEGNLSARMHAFEAALFMIGYDLEAIEAFGGEGQPIRSRAAHNQ